MQGGKRCAEKSLQNTPIQKDQLKKRSQPRRLKKNSWQEGGKPENHAKDTREKACFKKEGHGQRCQM